MRKNVRLSLYIDWKIVDIDLNTTQLVFISKNEVGIS